jgi:phosphopantothenate---cysteine ligase (ATP)
MDKAIATIDRYGVDVVVANMLDTRYELVHLIFAGQPDADGNGKTVQQIRRQGGNDIEQTLMSALVDAHEESIRGKNVEAVA